MDIDVAEQEIRYLSDVQRLVLKPGDVIVLSVPGRITAEERYGISQKMGAVFPDHICMVLEEGMDIGIVSKTDSVKEAVDDDVSLTSVMSSRYASRWLRNGIRTVGDLKRAVMKYGVMTKGMMHDSMATKMISFWDENAPGMHRTDSLGYGSFREAQKVLDKAGFDWTRYIEEKTSEDAANAASN